MKLTIVTTVPETLLTILKGQPRWLSQYSSVVCVSSPGPLLESVEQKEGVVVIPVPMSRGINPIKDLVSIYHMYRVLRQNKSDIVHSYTPKAGLVCMIAGFFAGIRVRIHTFTGLIFPTSGGLKRKILIATDRLICAAATHVIPEGEGVAADLRANGITAKPLRTIGNGNIAGVDVEYFNPAQTNSTELASHGTFTFCFIGRLNKDKGLQELIAAFTSLGGGARLLLVGDIDHTAPVDDRTLRLIQSHPKVQTTGFLDDIRPALVACDVLVLPSYREGFPNVLLQAGAMAKPVIASDINGCNEVIENDFNGWLVPSRNVKALAECMGDVMSLSIGELGRLGNNARNRIVERYEQNSYRRKLLQYYGEVIREAGL